MRSILLCGILLFGISLPAQKAIKTRLAPLMVTINQYLDTLIADKEWQVLAAQFKDNRSGYCVQASIDLTFQRACNSHLDCMCKEHELGQGLKRYRDGDPSALDKLLGQVPGQRLSDVEVLTRLNHHIDWVRAERQQFVDDLSKSAPPTPKNYILSLQPLNLFSSVVSVSFEWKLSPHISMRSGASFLASGFVASTYLGYANDQDFSFFAHTGGKIYVVGESMASGFYAEPRIDLGYENKIVQKAPNTTRVKELAVVPAVLVGFDKLFPIGIQIDIGFGVGYHWAPAFINDSIFNKPPAAYDINFVIPKFQASIGYSW